MCAALYATSRRQSAVVGQKRPYTSLGGRFECSGRGHGRTQPFLHWPETATTHATSSLWCDVVRGRSTEREAASHGARLAHRVERIESTNQIGSHGRLARPCSPVKPYIYSTYKLTSVLLLYCAHVHRFWPKKTDPANRQIWFAIQFTTNPLDGGDFKRLCHGRTKRFVPAPRH